ncbi:6-phosphofructokinase 1 [Desulfosalsimonas propionicica]|uniref:ATP-dependent 6-phosphofructokinase n=1 Tax=Desulfosalsimonas propionicica TaxID=332175 RepID=A0A7W0CAT2_9BACT|nr:ATP-dependent 6-phosphofructokinase [Desulfosalsimonas propionicica]MBA2882326.1 6-phosphofructokinase 1 [Desulfosalsimonas propionicica]
MTIYTNIDMDMDTRIDTLGEAKIESPIAKELNGSRQEIFKDDNERVLIELEAKKITEAIQEGTTPPSFELAGPRKKIYFDPSKLKCALVTCGGLCPGLNNIIRSIVLELYHSYGVRHIYGVRYGLQGFIPEYQHDVRDLSPANVVDIHEMGGSILGSSRGPQDIEAIVDCLERMNIGILFMIGGDGTLMAASKIDASIRQRGLKISVIGVPKTIDNDIHMVSKSFGFDTAVDIATGAIKGAHKEAEGYPNGIGLIKLMGRYSGFIAATATLAQQDVNFVLIPEIDFDLEGPNGLITKLQERLAQRKHAVILIAEGAGQKFFESHKAEYDPSGNIKLHDIGLFLKEQIQKYFAARDMEISLKYIDPSYMIRSLPANSNDHVYCTFLGRDAVHAGMAGKTNMIIGHWNDHFVHVPVPLTAGRRKHVFAGNKLWQTVLEATGQGSLVNP